MAGLLDSIFGGGGGGADDPYADILTPAQRNHMQAQGLLAMAGAFAQAGMPSRLPVPFGSALGAAAAALGTGQEAGMKTAIENALAAQKVRDLRNMAEFRKKFLGDIDPTSPLGRAIAVINAPGGAPSPGGAAPPAGTYAGPGTPAGAGGGGLLSPDLTIGSDKDPDYITRGLAPRASGGGLLDYPADQGTMRAGGGLVPEAPDAGLGTATPSSDYAPGGKLYPFKDLGVVPGAGGGGAPAAAASQQSAATPGGGIIVDGVRYPNALAWRRAVDAREAADLGARFDLPAAAGAPTPVPEVTGSPGGTNGIDPRKRAALDAILGGMQTAQGGPSAQRLPQFAGPGAADAPADTVPEGGGLLGVAPDLRAPIEANPFARQASPGDPRGVAPLIRQAMLRQGVDPNVALRVAQSEGLATFLGDAGKSGGAFQLYTGGGLGNEFQKQTGLDPLDPKNEAATIDWVAKNVNRTGWSPYHGAAKVGIGPRTGLPGGDLPPDELIPSGPGAGGGLPPVVRAQYAPGGGGAAMPAAPGAAPPAAGGVLAAPSGGGLLAPPPAANQAAVNTLLLELARRNAAAEVLGMGNPYNSLLGVLQGSPAYKGQIKGAEEAATEPYRQIARDQELKNALVKEGWQLNDKGQAIPVPLYNDVAAAKANAISTATEGPKLDSALAQQNRMRVYDAEGHVMIVPIPGGAETEAMGKGLTASAEAAAKAPYETKDVRVVGPDGQPATETMTVAEFNRRQALRAKNAAMGAGPQPGDIITAPALTPGQTTSQQQGAEAGWKALQETHAAELAANRRDQQLGQLAEAMQGFRPGATAELRTRGAAILRDIGLIKGDEVPSAETFQRAARQLQITAAPKGQGSTSNYERELYAEAVPAIVNSPESLAKAVEIAQRLDQYDRSVAQIHREVASANRGTPDLIEAQRRIALLGPPLSPGEIGALEQIRAGKVPGRGDAATAPLPAGAGAIKTPYGTITPVQ